MRIRKYDFDYGRRALLEKTAKGAAAAGIFAPVWPMIANASDVSKAYPDELMSIEMFTKGKIKTGDTISASNVEDAKELLDPFTYNQIKNQGRLIKIRPSERDLTKMYPKKWLEVSIKNKGQAVFGPDGNVYTKDGKTWIGGAPFPELKTGAEALANMSLCWGKHDYCGHAIRERSVSPAGDVDYKYEFIKVELQITNRLDGTIFQNKKDLLRAHTFAFAAPAAQEGTSFLDIWHYDQRKFNDLYGYLPDFRRVRQFPTNQRFEPLIPGVVWLLTDPWGAGDPMLTWGNFKIVERRPMLGPFQGNWSGSKPNWDHPTHGGKKGTQFFNAEWEMVPEMLVVDFEPTGYPRAPVSKKRAWIDARTGNYFNCGRYDRAGNPWVNFELGSGQMIDGNTVWKDNEGNVEWSWHYVHIYDVQTGRISLIEYKPTVTGGHKSELFADPEVIYNKYCTQEAIQRLGKA
ncbi:uncharacterized protein DUF1329 [Panacagrimonas perspica]|uniref:Uncharacterized protein DUF1329 n=1 Tax=Panacagrimonas perspica TaxID=381431 RepID=A0A4S3K2S6_9GAMM|nr:DUF1329 domain-containing protein [Panacagrimonas perspica]TDU28881.1 uncharacterized protein DUF1329 [Panacagrimonas perspica]THD02292.1 hypothetical protein B1810_15300 [Panacagrimonas perspica]